MAPSRCGQLVQFGARWKLRAAAGLSRWTGPTGVANGQSVRALSSARTRARACTVKPTPFRWACPRLCFPLAHTLPLRLLLLRVSTACVAPGFQAMHVGLTWSSAFPEVLGMTARRHPPLPSPPPVLPHITTTPPQVLATAPYILGYVVIGPWGLLLVAEKFRVSASLPGNHEVKTVTKSHWIKIPLQLNLSLQSVQVREAGERDEGTVGDPSPAAAAAAGQTDAGRQAGGASWQRGVSGDRV